MSAPIADATRRPRKILRFGVFELDVRTGELRKQGIELRLQGHPLHVLQALVNGPAKSLLAKSSSAAYGPPTSSSM